MGSFQKIPPHFRGPQLSCGRSHCTLRLGCTKTPGHHAPWRGNQNDGGLDFWVSGGREGCFWLEKRGDKYGVT